MAHDALGVHRSKEGMRTGQLTLRIDDPVDNTFRGGHRSDSL